MNKRSAAAPLLVALLATACGGGVEAPSVGPNDIPRLEASLREAPDDADRAMLLGVALYNAGRFDDAVTALDRAVTLEDAEPVAWLYLGLAHEARERWSDASAAYSAFLAQSPERSDVREDIEHRIALVQRHVLEEELQAMLADEAALANQPARPRTVAVFPFRIVADDPRYEPLQYALADMVTTDLALTGTLQLVERAQIQALVREMALSLAGFTDPANGARVGRLMRAASVVQGNVVLLGDDQLRMEMTVVDPAAAERRGSAVDETALERIFDAEKQLVLELLGVLGVTLTAAEREAIEENRTGSLLALLAYGEGLEAMDRGDFGAASAAFSNAVSIDPGFQAAQTRSDEAAGLQDAAETSGADLAAAAEATLPGAPESAIALVDQIIPDINRSGADQTTGNAAPGAEVTGKPASQDSNATAPGVRVPIVIDNPNVE